ncbi:MAG: redoxin domain-containing protein [Thermogutta sp.]|nr:redoxin domain-containing protein [Thermogutta sp.]
MAIAKAMSNISIALLLFAMAGLAWAEGPGNPPVRKELKVGDPAPDFALKGSDGKTYRLSDFRGKQIVVLAWYPKAFTPGCTRECKSFATRGHSLKALPVAFFTASIDTPEDNRRFAESLGVKYPILSDPTRKTAMAYGVVDGPDAYAKRWTFIIGMDGRILHIDKAVKVETHAEDVAAWISEWLKASASEAGS